MVSLPTSRSLLALDALNFFLAEVRDGLVPWPALIAALAAFIRAGRLIALKHR